MCCFIPPRYAFVTEAQQVRQAPNDSARVLGRLARGTRVYVGTCQDGWCGVAWQQVRGFAPARALSDSVPQAAQTTAHTGKGYINVNGEWVPSPAFTSDGLPPPNASARCGDGSYSFSRNRQGTCSWHGGVAEWLGQ